MNQSTKSDRCGGTQSVTRTGLERLDKGMRCFPISMFQKLSITAMGSLSPFRHTIRRAEGTTSFSPLIRGETVAPPGHPNLGISVCALTRNADSGSSTGQFPGNLPRLSGRCRFRGFSLSVSRYHVMGKMRFLMGGSRARQLRFFSGSPMGVRRPRGKLQGS